jgi:Ras-related protein Rab-24
MKKVEVNGRACNLGIWVRNAPRGRVPWWCTAQLGLASQDTAGQERFDSLSSFYCRGARAAIICYDLTDRSSFDCIQSKWIKKVVEEAEQGCHMCLVGTKVDLVNEQLAQRAVRKEEVDALAAKHKAHSFETSAKQGSGVGEIFQCIVEGFQARVQAVDDGRRQGLATGATHKQGGCCWSDAMSDV